MMTNVDPPKFGKGAPVRALCTCGRAKLLEPWCKNDEKCPYSKKAKWPKK